jgi:hypothetical protein
MREAPMVSDNSGSKAQDGWEWAKSGSRKVKEWVTLSTILHSIHYSFILSFFKVSTEH